MLSCTTYIEIILFINLNTFSLFYISIATKRQIFPVTIKIPPVRYIVPDRREICECVNSLNFILQNTLCSSFYRRRHLVFQLAACYVIPVAAKGDLGGKVSIVI